ncbi:MAG: NCS2 family permease, partial [Clostridia bacterium]|nr:NCS2 family permease [Clostridia bacterium]
MEKLFHLEEHGTNVKTEIIAGITTFLAMAYILAVNPSILGNVMDANGVFVATALASALATFLMAFLANYPIALSAGLGLNAYFAFTVCLSELKDVPDPWTIALTAVFVEGIIFILMSFFKFREAIVNGIPQNLKFGITAGIGLFITIIGMKGAGIVIADESTLLGLGSFSSPEVVLCLIGLMIIVILQHYQITGAIMIGILGTWALGMIAQLTGWYDGLSMFPSFADGLHLDGIKNTAFHLNFSWAGQHIIQFVAIVFSFLFVDLFDTVGTVVGVADKANLLNEDGTLPRAGRVLMSDAVGTTVGALLGTSTVTSFVESSAGVAAGGRTGLTSATTGTLFLLALFLAPIFLAIPTFATSAALIYVGMLMMSSVTKMKFEGDAADAIGGF